MHGGGHERGMRSGTLPTHQIVGMGEAFRIAQGRDGRRRTSASARCATGCGTACQDIEEVYLNGDIEHRVPHNLNVSFNFVEGESLIMAIKDIAVSSGSACTSASLEPSLRAARAGPQRRARAQLDPLHASAASRPRKRSTTRSTSLQAKGREAARAVAAVGDVQGRHRHRARSSGRRIESGLEQEYNMAYSDKVVDHYENPRNVGSFDKGDETRRHRHGRRAGLRRRDEAADQGRRATAVIEDARSRPTAAARRSRRARSSPNGSRARRSTRR